MNFLYSDEPIIACSTCNLANAALSVLRISGFKDLSVFRPFFTISGPIEPRRVYYTKVVLQDHFIDDICLTYFQAPHSFNGENTLELSVHGNTLNTERIINLFVEHAGCRPAGPGEFTYRALKNKKLTLTQVEGLDLFLNANSGYALDQGLSLLSGSLHQTYQELLELFTIHKSSLELSIDFLDDVGEEAAKASFDASLEAFRAKFDSLVKRVKPEGLSLVQPEIVLAGLPNSGKSSLFNLLLSEERAIVSSEAGTTRDYISESLVVDGVKFKLIDTAGIRLADNAIEIEGIRRTKKRLEQSFFSLLLINPFELVDGFSELLEFPFDLILFTHKDLPGFLDAREKLEKTYPKLGSIGALSLLHFDSAAEKSILEHINKKYFKTIEDSPLLLERHKYLILKSSTTLQNYINLVQNESDIAIISSELNILGHCLSELIGIISPDKVLNSIFSNFCIGK